MERVYTNSNRRDAEVEDGSRRSHRPLQRGQIWWPLGLDWAPIAGEGERDPGKARTRRRTPAREAHTNWGDGSSQMHEGNQEKMK